MIFSTALVTGGTGFIGTALCRRLAHAGVRLTLLTRPGRLAPDGCEAVAIDSIEKSVVLRALSGRRFDIVFHLAACGVSPGDRDPDVLLRVNVGGTDAIVHAAAAAGAGAVVYVGSCSEYCAPTRRVAVSEDAPLGTRDLYGVSKAAAGLWGQALAASHGIGFQRLRLFNVFGPGEAQHRLIPSIISSLSRNVPVALSPGDQVRDYLFIEDVVDGLALAADAALKGSEGPFNLCSGQPVTVKAVALAVAEAMAKPKDLLAFGALNYRPDECLWLVGRPDRFEDVTGFRPNTSLAAGLKAAIAALHSNG